MKHPLLFLENISKSFPGVKALKGVSFTLEAGSIHALMGENGAGKSTLMKCLFGVYEKDEGKIFLCGKEVDFKNSKAALENGVAMVHQELNQAQDLTVMDNIWLGRFPRIGGLPIVSHKEMYRKTRELFEKLGISIDPRARVGSLPVSKRQLIEIAKAVSYEAKVIVLDEPTSSLTEREAEKLFKITDMLKKEGCGIIYISHKMEEILRICDTVTVMRDGELIDTLRAKDIDTDEIIRLMVGRTLTERYPQKLNTPGEVMLEIKNLSDRSERLKDININLKKGEILGIAGLDGAGRSELFEAIFGLRKLNSGKIILDGKELSVTSPKEAIKEGFAYLTEERRKSGIFSILPLVENTTISSLKDYRYGPLLSSRKMVRTTREYIEKTKVKTPSEKTKILALSGGNQQKVILSRWLLTDPKVLLLDEPTRGIDVGAKYEIYKLIISLAQNGRGVIVVSSEMGELFGICDRLYVMSGGRISGELSVKEATQEKIMAMASRFV